MLTINAIRQTARGTPIWQPGAINLHVSVPCPLKVRLKEALGAFIDDYNQRHERPLFCPSILDGIPHGIDDLMQSSDNAQELPDIWVSTGLHTAFSQPFKQRFIDSGIYQGVTHPAALPLLPPELKAAVSKHNLGFLAFGFWQLVCDTSLCPDGPYPARWADLLDPHYRQQIAIHGCDGHVGGMTLAELLQDQQGEQAVAALAANIKAVRHFSQLIKGMNSADPLRAPFNLMPGAAASQIPSSKRAALIEVEEGPLLAPMLLYVKASLPQEDRQAVLAFLQGETMRTILRAGDYHLADQMDWQRRYSFPEWDNIAADDYNRRSEALSQQFIDALAPGVMMI